MATAESRKERTVQGRASISRAVGSHAFHVVDHRRYADKSLHQSKIKRLNIVGYDRSFDDKRVTTMNAVENASGTRTENNKIDTSEVVVRRNLLPRSCHCMSIMHW
jgi:hypothetical protein